jgi:hypothetical protein
MRNKQLAIRLLDSCLHSACHSLSQVQVQLVTLTDTGLLIRFSFSLANWHWVLDQVQLVTHYHFNFCYRKQHRICHEQGLEHSLPFMQRSEWTVPDVITSTSEWSKCGGKNLQEGEQLRQSPLLRLLTLPGVLSALWWRIFCAAVAGGA